MDLHRVEKEPDWAKIPPGQWNMWQKTAIATKGLVTIGNFFSLLGLVSVPFGLLLIINREQYAAGVIILVAGRLCDLLDGWLADKTGTKSPLGEKMDATIDKVSIGIAAGVLAAGKVMPLWVVLLLALPHVVIAALSLIVFFKGSVMHPSRIGKLSMAVASASLLAFIVLAAADGSLRTAVMVAAYALFAASVLMGAQATVGYARELRRIARTA